MAADSTPKVFPAPVDWDELYPGRFMKAADFKGKQVTLTISEVRLEELVGDKGPQVKGVISFEKTEKQWALNKTNGLCLKELFGKKVQEWVGRRVTLFPSTWNGEDCIRVYGSPELEANKEVVIALPRRRAFNMTMHRTAPARQTTAARNASPATRSESLPLDGPPSDAEAIKQLRETRSIDAFIKAKKSLWAVYDAARQEIPLEVDAAASEHRQTLEDQL